MIACGNLIFGVQCQETQGFAFREVSMRDWRQKNLIIYMEDGFSRGLREILDGGMSIRRIFIRRMCIRRMSIRRIFIGRMFIRRMLIRRIFISGKTVSQS